VTKKSETETISRRRAFSILGLAALSLATASTVLMESDADAQQPTTPTGQTPQTGTATAPQTGTERRQGRRAARSERRQQRRTARTERRQERRTARAQRRQVRRGATPTTPSTPQ
jgi:hypothetical protein